MIAPGGQGQTFDVARDQRDITGGQLRCCRIRTVAGGWSAVMFRGPRGSEAEVALVGDGSLLKKSWLPCLPSEATQLGVAGHQIMYPVGLPRNPVTIEVLGVGKCQNRRCIHRFEQPGSCKNRCDSRRVVGHAFVA